MYACLQLPLVPRNLPTGRAWKAVLSAGQAPAWRSLWSSTWSPRPRTVVGGGTHPKFRVGAPTTQKAPDPEGWGRSCDLTWEALTAVLPLQEPIAAGHTAARSPDSNPSPKCFEARIAHNRTGRKTIPQHRQNPGRRADVCTLPGRVPLAPGCTSPAPP